MPVKLAKAAWLQGDKRGGNGLGGREVGGIDLVEGPTATRNLLAGVLQGAVHEACVSGEFTAAAGGDGAVRDGTVNDIGVRGGEVVERSDVDSKVPLRKRSVSVPYTLAQLGVNSLSNDIARCVC